MDREVVYRIRLANDDGNAAILKRFADLHTQTYNMLAKLATEFAQKKQRTEEDRLAAEEKAQQRAADKERKRREKEANDNRRLIEQQAAEQEKADQRIIRSHETATRQLLAGRRQLTEGLLSTQEAVNRLGRGFTLLGLIGEKDMAKIVAELAKVQAIIDITSGGVRLYVSLTKAVDGYTKSVSAAAAAEAALAAARGRSAAAGGAGALSAAGGAAQGVGSLASGGGGAAAVGTGGTVLAAVAAIAAVTAVLWELGEVATGTAGRVGSVTDRIGSAEASGAAWLHEKSGGYLFGGGASANDRAFQGLSESNQRVKSQSKSVEQAAAAKARERRLAEIDRMEAYGPDVDPGDFATGDRVGDLNRAFGQNNKRLGQARDRLAGGDTSAAADVGSFAEKGASLLSQRLNVEREITREKVQQAREGIRGAEEELKLVDERLTKQREGLLTAKEKFGQMSSEDQTKLIEIKKKADASGFGALSREERQALRGIDTEGTTGIARKGDLAAADAAGFDKFFGAEERKKIAELEGQKLKVGVELTDKRNIVVQLEAADAKLVASVGEQVKSLVAERDAALLMKLKAEVNQLRIEMAQQNNQQLANRQTLFGLGG